MAMKPTPVFALGLLMLLAIDTRALAQTEVTGTRGLRPQEMKLPTDASPAFSFVNKTGVAICDFVIAVTKGSVRITGGVLDDPNHPPGGTEDWDVDDNGNGQLDPPVPAVPAVPPAPAVPAVPAEGATAPAAEGAGPAALANPDNTQAARNQIRIEEVGFNNCVGRNRSFEITLTFTAAPTAGDEISLQPTNGRGRNLYAWVDKLDKKQRFAMLPGGGIKPTFAAIGFQDDVLVNAIAFKALTPGLKFLDFETTPKGETSLAEGMVYFDKPVRGAKGITVEATMSDYGVVAVSADVTYLKVEKKKSKNAGEKKH